MVKMRLLMKKTSRYFIQNISLFRMKYRDVLLGDLWKSGTDFYFFPFSFAFSSST